MASAPQLMDFLPAIYRGDPDMITAGRQSFLYYFLLPFQRLFMGGQDGAAQVGEADGQLSLNEERTGRGARLPEHGNSSAAAARSESVVRGLSEEIAQFSRLLDPLATREDFLSWLSDWVALNIHAPLSPAKRRQLIARFISLSRIRGTKKYLEELLPFFIDAGIAIEEEQAPECQIGVHSTLDRDFQIGGGPPHFFRVVLSFAARTNEAHRPPLGRHVVRDDDDNNEIDRQCRIAEYVISMSKPAHTRFELTVITAAFQIGVHSTIGRDTVLG